MAVLGEDERYWLESNWKATSLNTLKLVVPLAHDVIVEIVERGIVGDACWNGFVADAVRALDERRRACVAGGADGPRSRAAMYATAISLFGDAAAMRAELTRSADRLRDGSGAVAWSCLRSGFYAMRLRTQSEIPNRAKTWRRLELIMARMRDEAPETAWGITGPERYPDALCAAIAARVRKEFPRDKNLPREIDTVRAMIGEFRDDIADADPDDAVSADDVLMLPDLRLGLTFLAECVAALVSPFAGVYATALQRGGPSITAYCSAEGITRRKFYHLHEQTETILGDCVRGKFAARQAARR